MAKMATLQDNFTGNTLNATLWSSATGGTTTLSYSENGVSVNLPATATGSDAGIVYSNTTYDLTGSYLAARILVTPNPATNAYGDLQAQISNENLVGWNIQGGTLEARYVLSGSITGVTSFSYNPGLHVFWRVRESGGTTYWDTSPNGTDWTNRASVANPITETALVAQVSASCYEPETSPGHFVLNSLNVFPAIVYPLPGPVRARIPSRISGGSGAFRSGTVPKIIQLTNGFDGGTQGTAISTANSGTYGNAFDVVTTSSGTATYDDTYAAHGQFSAKITVSGSGDTAFLEWSSSLPGKQLHQIWFRQYLYFMANPGTSGRVFAYLNSAGSNCAIIDVNTSGNLFMNDNAGSAMFTFTGAIPLNRWFRIEGYIYNSATAGYASMSLYDSADSVTATESHTSAATFDTLANGASVLYGVSAATGAIGPYWMDSIGVSNAGYLGPAYGGTPIPLQGEDFFDSISLPSVITTFPSM